MPPRPLLSAFTPSFARRLAKTPLRRKTQILPTVIRSFSTTAAAFSERPTLHARFVQAGGQELPSPAALSALLARLSLPNNPLLHEDILACLTHPSYNPIRPDDAGESPESPLLPNNELFDSLGNSLLGMFVSEHLSRKFPLMPTETLKLALTAYAGPVACESVGRELGIGVIGSSSGQIGVGEDQMPASGIPIRWSKTNARAPQVEMDSRFRKFFAKKSLAQSSQKPANFVQVIASTVRAFIGLIYQEQGMHAARDFVHAHFLTRHLDLAALFAFHDPMTLCKEVVARHLAEAGVPSSSDAGKIITRVLAETGVQSHRPLINVGLFLPSGIKLGEGFGSSYQMAQHRAATNALLSLFLVRGDQKTSLSFLPPMPSELPSEGHVDFPLDAAGVVYAEEESYRGNGFGALESVQGSSKEAVWGARAKKAKHVVRA